MKNKIVTLICIFAIVATTAVVALASGENVQYTNDDASVGSDSLISHAVTGDPNSVLYPGCSLSRNVTVTAGSSNAVLVRNVFAFEAENLQNKAEFDEVFEVTFGTDGWQIDEWFPITHDGEFYMMTSAIYTRVISKGSNVSMSYSVRMNERVSSDIAEQFDDGNGYEVLVSSQGVQAEGWKEGNTEIVLNSVTIKSILDQVFGEVKADYEPIWDDSASSQGY